MTAHMSPSPWTWTTNLVALRSDDLPRCQAVHPQLGQCRGIAGIENHRHYSEGNQIWENQETDPAGL